MSKVRFGNPRVGEEELALAREGGSERAALARRVSGMRGDDEDAASIAGRQAARKILDEAASSKSITKPALSRAVELYAGPRATGKEKAAVAAKVFDFLKTRKIDLKTT